MFKEHQRSSFTDLLNRKIYRFRVGDRVLYNGRSGIIIERRGLNMVLESMTNVEAKELLSRLNTEYQKASDYYVAVVQIKNLIYFLEPHQIEPDTSYK